MLRRRRERPDDEVVEARFDPEWWVLLPCFGVPALLMFLLLPPNLAAVLAAGLALATGMGGLTGLLIQSIAEEQGVAWRLDADSLEVRGMLGLLRTVPRAELGEVRTEGRYIVIETAREPVRIPREAERATRLANRLRAASHPPDSDAIGPEQIAAWLGLEPGGLLTAQSSLDRAVVPLLGSVALLLLPAGILLANQRWYNAPPNPAAFAILCLTVLLTLRVIWRRAAPVVINGHGIFQGTRRLAGWGEVESLGGRYDGAFRVGSRTLVLDDQQGVAVADDLARLAPAVAEGRLTAPVGDVPDQALALAAAPAAAAERGLSRVDPGEQGVRK